MLADPRTMAFCAEGGPEIFRPVAFPTEVWYPDPLDVEAIFADARELYERLLRQATAPGRQGKAGRILLLRGESGSGKTHLMRAFRTRTHQLKLGYFGYMQMTTLSGNYSRYILQKLIDSLDQPYYTTSACPDTTTGLMRLSTAVAESDHLPRADLQRLRESDMGHDERAALVLDLADDAVCDPLLRDIPLDLIRAMLFLQSGYPAIRNRVMKYLRAESLSEHDRQRLGGISPLDRDESAQMMIERLGQLMWTVHGAALVLCVDQLEDIAYYEGAEEKFRRAIKGLTQVAAQVSSALIVVSCLDDYYDRLRGYLDQSALDRIESDPAPLMLAGVRTWDEIRAIVSLHLNYLFDAHDVPVSDELSTDPIPESLLRAHVNQPTRTVLKACKAYRDACVAAGRLVPELAAPGPLSSPPPPSNDEESAWQTFDQSWNDFLASFERPIVEDDQQLADLLAESIELCSDELSPEVHFTTDSDGLDTFVFATEGERVDTPACCLVRLCNRAPQGGGLGKQIEGLLKAAAETVPPTTPVVVRCTEYQPKGPKAAIAGLFAELYSRGGRYVIVHDTDWRTMAAIQDFRLREQEKPHFDTWLRRAQPLVRLKPLQEIMAIDGARRRRGQSEALPESPSQTPAPAPAPPAAGQEVAAPPQRPDAPERACDAASGLSVPVDAARSPAPVTDLLVGHARSHQQQPQFISCQSLTLHTAFLGSTGSGKTTAALNLIEQLLLGGIPALLIDRKGDLVSYASQRAWERELDDPALQQRQQQLRTTLDVAVYTPGRADGRPIRLPIVPSGLAEMVLDDRNRIVQQAAHSLGSMLGYKPVGKSGAYIAILDRAITTMVEQGFAEITIDGLIDYIHQRDDALLSAIGLLNEKSFEPLLVALQTLSINKQSLFPKEGEPLSAEHLFGLAGNVPPGKTRLSVISTKFLGDTASIQFWVAQLLQELIRWTSKHPISTLQAVVLFDEADLYLPAIGNPATKSLMDYLLKRARSAGLGMMLATQSPGDFDYKCRENINTWLLGKVTEEVAIKKMKPVFRSCKRDVSAELPGQGTGEFFCIQQRQVTGLRSLPSAILPRQVPEADIPSLARGTAR